MIEKVRKFNEEKSCHLKPMSPSARVLDIMSEVGELSKEILKSSKYGTTDFKVTDDYIMEYGDVLYSLLSLADESGINAEECLTKVIDKYRLRIQSKGSMGSENS